MNIEKELVNFKPDRESVLTVGVFDGVHRGHRHLLCHLTTLAEEMDLLAGVVTFRNHPGSVLRSDFVPHYLASLDDRLGLIADLGIDFAVPITFDDDLSQLRASEFVALLRDMLKMRAMVIGPDFSMGYRREADAKMLVALGEEMGFPVVVVEPFTDEHGNPIRSTTIRELLAIGDVIHVATLMGRYFPLGGTVVRGSGLGSALGFPTANLQVPEAMAVPGNGIYTTWAEVEGRRYMAATSIGNRPTFEGAGYAIEVFVLDFQANIYGREMRLEFVSRLREQVKFDTEAALQNQMEIDVCQTRTLLETVAFD